MRSSSASGTSPMGALRDSSACASASTMHTCYMGWDRLGSGRVRHLRRGAANKGQFPPTAQPTGAGGAAGPAGRLSNQDPCLCRLQAAAERTACLGPAVAGQLCCCQACLQEQGLVIGDHPPSGAIHQLHPADQHRAQEHSLWLSHPSRRKLRRPAAPLTDAPQLRPSSMPLGWRTCFIPHRAGRSRGMHVRKGSTPRVQRECHSWNTRIRRRVTVRPSTCAPLLNTPVMPM